MPSTTAALEHFPFTLPCDLLRDPFAAVFGTRRGLTPKMRTFRANAELGLLPDFLGFAFMLGKHDLPYAELSVYPSFQPILSSSLFQLSSQDERKKLFRVHLGIFTISQQDGSAQFAVMVVERDGLAPDSPFETHIRGYVTLGDALNHARSRLVNRMSIHPPDPGDPLADLMPFTAEMFSKAFSRRLAGS